ncbi:unnamed protein product [Polarella glacialis]|uniref:Uncharacterized protein n=1 Tax=Polarella glacialis TaxID=89957 RepID=A0A813DZ22_POLGL|nr:unnamed protein product [Polarella glacialis]CAE8653576.1 unnamed protein product [Polarella glacialis]CAE8720595.1 unnamed protein product [Polarella glacialis]
MDGLRRINSNYVAAGDGRDLTINQNQAEARIQDLNPSLSSAHHLREPKARPDASAKLKFPLVGSSILSPSSLSGKPGLLRAFSEPKLKSNQSSKFKPRWNVPAVMDDLGGHQKASLDLEEDPAQVDQYQPSYWIPKDQGMAWPAPGFVHPHSCFDRTENGGFWPS